MPIPIYQNDYDQTDDNSGFWMISVTIVVAIFYLTCSSYEVCAGKFGTATNETGLDTNDEKNDEKNFCENKAMVPEW